MQTFLPYPDLRASCRVLDSPRLGKQRVETFQILRALTWPEYAWKNHPAVRMWRGFVPGLVAYGVENCREWTRRGHADTVLEQLLAWTGGEVPVDPPLPPWWGRVDLHLSHRSALLRKDPAFYRPLFGPDEPDDLPYLWPPDTYPRWPVRRGGRDLDLAGALQVLGLEAARPWQAAAVAAVGAGRDVLLVAAPGSGGSTTGHLAALSRPGTTRWVRPPDAPVAYDVPPVPLLPPRPPAEPPDGPDEPPARPGPVARTPSEADLDAVRAEADPPEVLFGTAPAPLPPGCTLLVLETGAGPAPAVPDPVPAHAPPVLAVVPRVAEQDRPALAAALGLRDPVALGGGWDLPGTWLQVAPAAGPLAVRRTVLGLVRAGGPAVVATSSRDRLDRVLGALVGDGLRAAGWDPGMRPSRAVAAAGAWRSRRLDALVVVAGQDAPLGRGRVPLLVLADPPADADAWWAEVARVRPDRAVLIAPPGGALPGRPGCRRAALLAAFGEPVAVPCGACDVCAPADALVPVAPVSRRAAGTGAGRRARRRPASGSPAG